MLPQIHIQAEASLTAYTNDDGDFSEVVRARIAELNAEIDALAIQVGMEKTVLELNYLFINAASGVTSSQSRMPAILSVCCGQMEQIHNEKYYPSFSLWHMVIRCGRHPGGNIFYRHTR